MAATINDVAALAGVSIATVSRVMNGSANVSKSKQRLVEEAIEKLHYRPIAYGQNWSGVKNNQILVLVPNIDNPFYSSVIRGVNEAAKAMGYTVLVATSTDSMDELLSYSMLLKSKFVRGMIVLQTTANCDEILSLGKTYPVVQCNIYDERIDLPYVGINDTDATKAALAHLYNIGCRKIAMINSDPVFRYASRREGVFTTALRRFGLGIQTGWIKYAKTIDFDRGCAASYDLLNCNNRPDAVFCVSDIYAAACIRVTRELGLRVPQDVAVIGFDNISISMMTTPTITTVDQHMSKVGSEACRLLDIRIKSPFAPIENILVTSDLIIRESTAGRV